MSESSPQVESGPAAFTAASPVAPLGSRTARGAVWFMGEALASKFVSVGTQISLAWLLARRDYGAVAVAYSVMTFIGLLQPGGARDILIQRAAHFRRWAAPVFWISVSIAGANFLLTLLAAPLAAWFFREPRLIGLLLILGLSNFVMAFSFVWEARLRIDLRFRFLATTGLAATIVGAALSITLAALHFGAYSFVLPLPVVYALRTAIYAYGARTAISIKPRLRRWKFVIPDSGILLAIAFLGNITLNGDYLILGRMYAKEVVGIYYWAWNFSTQALQLFAFNMGQALFPSLSHLNKEPNRQMDAFLRSAEALSVLVIPACFLQAAVARPAISLIFKPEWQPGIPMLQILSIGWALWVPNYAAQSLIKAQGRFRPLLNLFIFWAVVFLVLVFIGAWFAAGLGAAIGVAAYSWICGPLTIYVAIQPLGGTVRQVFAMVIPSLLLSAVATGLGVIVTWALPAWPKPWAEISRIAAVVSITMLIYMPFIRILKRKAWDDCVRMFIGMLRRSAA